MAHTASISQLQHPAWALVNGDLARYDGVRIHISAEALTRAVSVLEGVKGYWDTAGQVFSIRTPRRHYDRLCRSAQLMQIPVHFGYQEYVAWLGTLARALLVPDRDLWFRTTLHVTEGHWGEATSADLVTTAFTQRQEDPDPMRIGVSTWRRGGDVTLPARVKCSANYSVGRLARIEVGRHGHDDAVLLNEWGRVAEGTASCVVAVVGGEVVTPPPTEGCLDSITVDVLEAAAADVGTPFVRRPLDRTELLSAAECGLVGTVSELTMVEEVDWHVCGGPVLPALRVRYMAAMRGASPLPGVDLVPLVERAELAAATEPVASGADG